MGVFSGNQSFGSYNDITMNESFETLLESNTEACETDDFEEESLNAITTMHENYNTIMTAIGVTEAVAVERTGKEFVWTEGVLSDFGNKIKSFFKKIWEKIKGLFKRAIAMFDSYQMKDRAFVKKYRKEIFSGKDLSDFTFKGWNFDNLDSKNINNAIDACGKNSLDSIKAIGKSGGGYANYSRGSNSLGIGNYQRDDTQGANDREKLANKQMEKIEDAVEALRGIVLNTLTGKSGANSLTADEFRNEVKEWIHNGETEKEELDNISVNNLADYLVGSKTVTKNLNDLFKINKKNIDQDVKFIEGLQKEDWRGKPLDSNASPDEKDTAAARAVDLSYALRLCRESKEMLITLDGLLIGGYKERSRQYKACLVKIMHYNPKSESYNESYSGSDYYYSGNSFLAGVELK